MRLFIFYIKTLHFKSGTFTQIFAWSAHNFYIPLQCPLLNRMKYVITSKVAQKCANLSLIINYIITCSNMTPKIELNWKILISLISNVHRLPCGAFPKSFVCQWKSHYYSKKSIDGKNRLLFCCSSVILVCKQNFSRTHPCPLSCPLESTEIFEVSSHNIAVMGI